VHFMSFDMQEMKAHNDDDSLNKDVLCLENFKVIFDVMVMYCHLFNNYRLPIVIIW
jgi:hypothetical protein